MLSLQVGNLGLLFMLLFFIYAALGVELFGKLGECLLKLPGVACGGNRNEGGPWQRGRPQFPPPNCRIRVCTGEVPPQQAHRGMGG